MANHFSALKRMRQSRQRLELNKGRRTRLRHSIRSLRRAMVAGDAAKAQQLLPEVVSIIDKSLKKGVIKENSANRFKSRLMLRMAEMKSA
jgi:small subunit ribosomal protein S20